MKQKIRLTEGDFHRIIKRCINESLNNNVSTIIVNGQRINLEIGHSVQEWKKLYSQNKNLWDISLEDFITGAVDPSEDIVYWYIDGRLYETE